MSFVFNIGLLYDLMDGGEMIMTDEGLELWLHPALVTPEPEVFPELQFCTGLLSGLKDDC